MNTNDLFNQAVILHQAGRISEAINLYLKIIPLHRDNGELLFTIGTAYCQIGKLEDGLSYLRKSARINPRNFHVFGNIGTLLSGLRKFDEAIANYNKALNINPNFPEALLGRANALVELKKYEKAISDYDKALLIAPDFAIAYCNKGKAQFEVGQHENAVSSYIRAIQLAPNLSEAYSNLGHALQELNRMDEAISSYKKAISLNPNCSEAMRTLPAALYIVGENEEAERSLQAILKQQPEFVEARWMKAMLTIPIIADSTSQIESRRKKLGEELEALNDWFEVNRIDDGYKAVGTGHLFYLAYHEENNKTLLSQYGGLCCRLMKHWQTKTNNNHNTKLSNKTIKIGIVSNHIFQHSVWDALISGWVEHLDRKIFKVAIFSKFAKTDKKTEFAKSTNTDFIKCNHDIESWVNKILSHKIDVLLYPEVGMDSMTLKLASMRLAPIQIASWGHPETTGLPTIDYYLSADLLEPENSEHLYVEKLFKLPNLGCCIKKHEPLPSTANLEDLGIAAEQPLFVCPGTPFKYQPAYDQVFVEIAKKMGQCQFLFFTYRTKEISELLKKRFQLSFNKAGLNFSDYCVFLPWLPKDSFYSLMKQADVFLDTIGFSGFNTAIQAIECGLPIVTREGKFMRGRLASGILKRIGLNELVVQNETDYVNMAVRLATKPDFKNLIRHKISNNRHVLYDDMEPIRALEIFIQEACVANSG